MAEGHDGPTSPNRTGYQFAEIFRCFQVALDPRKLLVAAAGVLAMSVGWYILSLIFWYPQPDERAQRYRDDAILKNEYIKKSDGKEYTAEERLKEGEKEYQRDLAQWKLRDELAGPGGKIRTMPWYEDRGENPYLFTTELVSSPSATWWDKSSGYVLHQIPVLAEPLFKLLLPVVKFFDSNATAATRLYLLLVLVWNVVVWAFAGGVITRIAAVQLSGKDRISLRQAIQFVANRYLSYLLSPLIPLGVVGVIIVVMALYGMLALIPILGDVLFYGLGFPLVVLGGVVITVLMLGLVGYPMMYTTLSTEGSDTFDALSRAYNYVLLAPWQYLWYSFVAVVYGAAVTFVVMFAGSLAVYMGKFAISQALLSEKTNQKQEYLFVYAPESYGWKELFLKGSPIEVSRKEINENGRVRIIYPEKNPEEATEYKKSYQFWNQIGAGMVTFWLTIVLLMLIGFGYSYFWSAVTMIYLLMRRKVDEVELDEVYLEEDMPEMPVTPPTTTNPGVASLPMVTAPVPPPVVPPAPMPPPAAVNYTGPVASLTPPPATVPPATTPPADAVVKPADPEKPTEK